MTIFNFPIKTYSYQIPPNGRFIIVRYDIQHNYVTQLVSHNRYFSKHLLTQAGFDKQDVQKKLRSGIDMDLMASRATQ